MQLQWNVSVVPPEKSEPKGCSATWKRGILSTNCIFSNSSERLYALNSILKNKKLKTKDHETLWMPPHRIVTTFSCWGRRLSCLFAGWQSEVNDGSFSCSCNCGAVGFAVARTLTGGVGGICLLIVPTVLVWLALVFHRALSFLLFSCKQDAEDN